MTETIKLMKAHTSVRRFKEQEIPQTDLDEILTAAQMRHLGKISNLTL